MFDLIQSQRSFARASLICNSMAVFFIMSVGFFVVPVPGWIRWFRWLSPYFYNFRIATLSQFRDRMFPCPGATGSLLAQCDGNGVLRGLGISPNQPLYPMFLGLLGFIIVCHGLSVLLLTVHHPGGVRHAARINTEVASKDLAYPELDLVRQAVDVEASNVKLRYASRALPNFKLEEKAILANMNARFPSGQVSAVMGPSGSGKSSVSDRMSCCT